jgi:hypothetical protein
MSSLDGNVFYDINKDTSATVRSLPDTPLPPTLSQSSGIDGLLLADLAHKTRLLKAFAVCCGYTESVRSEESVALPGVQDREQVGVGVCAKLPVAFSFQRTFNVFLFGKIRQCIFLLRDARVNPDTCLCR